MLKVSGKSVRIGALCVLLIFVLCWLHFFVDTLSDWSQQNQVQGIPLPFSYTASHELYHSHFPGLLYNSSSTFMEPGDPPLFPLFDLLMDWPPDNTDWRGWVQSKSHPVRGNSIPRFDYSSLEQQHLADMYRIAEFPFVLYNVPEILNASALFTFPKLKANFGFLPRMVEKSRNNHFMYYRMKSENAIKTKYPMWSPPQIDLPMTFPQFIKEAVLAESVSDFSSNQQSLYYMTINAAEVSLLNCYVLSMCANLYFISICTVPVVFNYLHALSP